MKILNLNEFVRTAWAGMCADRPRKGRNSGGEFSCRHPRKNTALGGGMSRVIV